MLSTWAKEAHPQSRPKPDGGCSVSPRKKTMPPTIRALSPDFDRLATTAIGVLEVATVQLNRMCTDASELRDENDLMYLASVAQLAAQRGMHLVEVIPDGAGDSAPGDLVGLLATLHVQLVEHTSGLDDFVVLEFVSEVGALCRGVRRYGEHH